MAYRTLLLHTAKTATQHTTYWICLFRWPWMTLKVGRMNKTYHVRFRMHLCSILRDFNCHSASRGPSPTAELFLVKICAMHLESNTLSLAEWESNNCVTVSDVLVNKIKTRTKNNFRTKTSLFPVLVQATASRVHVGKDSRETATTAAVN